MAQELQPRRSTIAANPEDSSRAARRARGRSRSGDGSSVVVNFMLVVVLAALVAAGWFIFNQYEEQKRSQQALATAEARITVLEDRLRLTDETLSETGEETKEELTFWESEIRKVWDIANKRNKGWIEDNRANIRKTTTAMASVQSDMKNLKSTVSRLDTSVARQEEVVERVNALDKSLQALTRNQRDLVDKANLASQIASSLKATLEPRVRENERAIEAFDGHRRQLSADIAELRRAAAP